MKKNKTRIFSIRTLSNIAVIAVGVLLYLLLSNFTAVRGALSWFFAIFTPFIIGLVIAYLLNMPMRYFARTIFAHTRRKNLWSIISAYLLAFFIAGLLLSLVLPQLVESVKTLAGNASLYFTNLANFVDSLGHKFKLDQETLDYFLISYNDFTKQFITYVKDILPNLLSLTLKFTMQIGSGIISGLTALIASIYMLSDKSKLLLQSRRVLYAVLPQRHADGTIRVVSLSNRIFSGFISGKLLDSAIIGVICFVFMTVMNLLSSLLNLPGMYLPFSLLISVIIGITNIIPFFGPFIGAIPSTMIILMVNPWGVLWFVIFIIALQQFDGNYLGPKILGESTGLPALWVLVAIIVGGGLFGFTGMVMGVPTAAVLYSLSSDFVEKRLLRKGLTNDMILQAGAPPAPVDPPADTGEASST